MTKRSYMHGGQKIEYETIIRYAVTHINKGGMRQLSLANQGRNHFDTPEAAEKWLAAFVGEHRSRLSGGRPETLAVRPVECYLHGDAVGIYFDEPAEYRDP